ncbi:LOW QUALITY PROTEIN: ribosomal-protein-S18p-alanine acetyltransferase [Bacillus sp. JCM 19046]|nr:LOW QUALITY PROTEIN: ribosomal-protein-S18p-alanine acetyltransferase [Bacillus sp. JCM 19045]GAF17564.1 LOW QUALITY PROTEIN: ribosomal-protein-S18p-alanine acetyltransferase [Bacillus sp. JCM 19046]
MLKKTGTSASVSIRKMDFEDIDAVLIVERDAFPTPWTRDAFISEVSKNKFAYYFVLELKGHIIGYCGLWKVMDEAQITNIAILTEHRGQSYGEYILLYVMQWLRGVHAKNLSLEVRESNTPAQSLYHKLGFSQVGVRKKYYADNQEDAWVMWVNLNDNYISN